MSLSSLATCHSSNADLLEYLASLAQGYDVVVPRRTSGVETLHAVYSVRCIQPIERLLDKGEVRIVKFFPDVRVRYVEEPDLCRFDPEGRSFVNINTPADWEYAQALVWQQEERPAH